MGWAIFKHAVSMIFNNFAMALRVSIAPFLLVILTGALAILSPVFLILLALVGFFSAAWTAVAWHRFILVEDYPGYIPPLRLDAILPYLGKTILLTLGLGVIAFVGLFALAPFLGLFPISTPSVMMSAIVLFTVLFVMILGWLWFRIGMVLPAIAVQKQMTFGESFRDTAPASKSIFLAVGILAVIGVLCDLVAKSAFGTTTGVGFIFQIASQWFLFMLGVSMLTTIYGHVIEGRDLVD